MRRYDVITKKRAKYENCILRYKLENNNPYDEANNNNFELMKKSLEKVGIWLDINDDELCLSIYPDGYIRASERNSGRNRKLIKKESDSSTGYYRYSDIVFMMQSMTDKEIAEKIKMPIATYKRHKKTMIESSYHQSLDLNRLQDKDYLESVLGNTAF